MGRGRIPGFQSLMGRWRSRAVDVVRRAAMTEEMGEILSSQLHRRNAVPVPRELCAFDGSSPYSELGAVTGSARSSSPPPPVFITGRFRSGSTLLWNLFRSVPGVTSYYEPFHERRWFDPAVHGGRVDPTHLGVSDYWAEYEGLAELGQHFSSEWKFRHLYMPASAWNPRMQRYIEVLIERSRGRAVLQFNEVDFRLSWLRARFPAAPIIHIYRHPRDQWCSTLLEHAGQAMCRLRDFEDLDKLYLLPWARDLRQYFPFLTVEGDAYAYELYYQVWRLSHLFGRIYADLSLSFESLLASPRAGVRAILDAGGMAEVDAERLVALIKPVTVGKWRAFAEGDWFGEIEARVDGDLMNYATGLEAGEGPFKRETWEASLRAAQAGSWR